MKTKTIAPKKSPHERNVRRERSHKKGPRATVVTVHHAKGRHPLAGSEERGIVFRHRALQLKMRGLSLREVALEIEREFELIQTPPIGTVYDWIQAALREGMRSNEDAVRDYVMLFRARSEEIIRVLIPFVLHDFLVERTKTINGVPVKVIEERVLKQRAMAAAEIRKQGESVLRAMGVNRAPPVREKTRSEDMTLLVIHTINQQIAAERGVTAGHAEKVVELTGGEPDARLTSL